MAQEHRTDVPMSEISAQDSSSLIPDGKYTVVARRYRPKDFDELVGQATIVTALTTAIQTNRVGHAYLFTGARGVGKTSTARIFAKALNASTDRSGHFDPLSDVSQAIDAGEDIDVLEIDGASNRGIDEIRQLRANVAVRPSRSPYKIYIIDEVHMLTGAAFNALLKTLEEPPPHVKFIFCTTDPEKIPITVLSRCQRFDFAPVKSDQILERLKFICHSEGAVAEDAALQLIARRAAGSMRDSQSLLEQILSFSQSDIRCETVHAILGTADESRLAEIANAMMAREASTVLKQLDEASNEGVDPGQLGEQLLGYLRDMMAIGIGAGPELLRTAAPSRAEELRAAATQWGTTTILAAIQLLDEALVKMRHSTQSKVLFEVAVVQICQLQDLQAISDLLLAIQSGKTPPMNLPTRSASPHADPTEKKKRESQVSRDAVSNNAPLEQTEPLPTAAPNATKEQPTANDQPTVLIHGAQTTLPAPSVAPSESDSESLASEAAMPHSEKSPLEIWRRVTLGLDGFVADCARMVVKIDVASNGHWYIAFAQGCEFAMQACEGVEHRSLLSQALNQALNRPVAFSFATSNLPPPRLVTRSSQPAPTSNATQPTLIRKYMEHPVVQSLLHSIDGEIVRVDPPKAAAPLVPKRRSSDETSELKSPT